ncbi:TIGR01777 family protein [Pseudoduganella sp. FT93W]|uniref:TIGR01777 family protein n=1 Tax=Duganella fentianensis TaxID=2692177 RepID=A0A845I4K1_9BURK|nr:TIGR01777 family oxidoreductase [Duganella fentianensis]MYN45888.1 TIGR01777 family protein [Duganella fentianensis]
MQILITGGSGMIGRALCQCWQAAGHVLTVLSRDPGKVAALCSGARGIAALSQLDASYVPDVVVNLAGAPIADRPWSARRKHLLWGSRITSTQALVEWMASRPAPVPVLLSASAVGWYGDAGEQPVDESVTVPGHDFGAQLCAAWEQAARQATQSGSRVVIVRIAPVLAVQGGMLARLLLPFRLGLGGRLGHGRQWMPWIHLEDLLALFDHLLQRPDCSGIYNGCTPAPVRNAEFTRLLAAQLRRPAILPAPAWLLRGLLGEMSVLLLGGQCAQPVRTMATGFHFRYARLEQALQQLLPSSR